MTAWSMFGWGFLLGVALTAILAICAAKSRR